jgi:hypothetical protein
MAWHLAHRHDVTDLLAIELSDAKQSFSRGSGGAIGASNPTSFGQHLLPA